VSRKAPRDSPEAALAAGLRLLAQREHAAAELKAKLTERSFDAAAVEAALQRLAGDGWLDDARYAAMLLRHRADQGYGERRIVAELRQWQVASGIIQATLDAFEAEWPSLALRQARRRYGETLPSESGRALRHLLQRGFPAEIAHRALRLAEAGQADPDAE
jgi:regulatory protein